MESNSQACALQRNIFLGSAACDLEVKFDDSNVPMAQLPDGSEAVLFEKAYDLMVVQPGNGARDQRLAGQAGKLAVVYNRDVDDPSGVELFDCMYVAPVAIQDIYYKYFGAYGEDEGLLCQSLRGGALRPDLQRFPEAVSNVCAKMHVGSGKMGFWLEKVCPNAQFVDKQPGKTKAPKCSLNYNLGVFDYGTKAPLRFNIHGTAIKPFSVLLEKIHNDAALLKSRGENTAAYCVKVESVVAPSGNYCYPKFTYMRAPEEIGDVARYAKVLRYYRENVFSMRQDDEAGRDNCAELSAAPAADDAGSDESDGMVGFAVN